MQYLALYAAVLVVLWVLYLRRQRRIQREHAQQLQAVGRGRPGRAAVAASGDRSACAAWARVRASRPVRKRRWASSTARRCWSTRPPASATAPAGRPARSMRSQLVFGTEKRGIDIPNVTPAVRDQRAGHVHRRRTRRHGPDPQGGRAGPPGDRGDSQAQRAAASSFDVVIVGCGPAGLSAGLSAIEHKLRYKLIEQEDSLGGAVFHYPRNKIAMTAPVKLALIGKVRFGEVQKEKLLEFWQSVVAQDRPADHVSRMHGGASTATATASSCAPTAGSYRTRSVLLTMGRRGTPRKLEVPGEESPKVVYRLIDPNQYDGQAVLVVGGGDSALEAAHRPGRAARHRGHAVVSQRRLLARQAEEPAGARAGPARAGRVRVELESTVESIEPDAVSLQTKGGPAQAAQRCGHRLRRRPAADAAAAEDRHPLRDQARHGLTGVESATGPANCWPGIFLGPPWKSSTTTTSCCCRASAASTAAASATPRWSSAAGVSRCRWCRPT